MFSLSVAGFLESSALYLDEGPCAPRMMDSAAYTVVTIAV